MAKSKETEVKQSYPEVIVMSVLKSYESEFNRVNEKFDTKFHMTLTNQKQAMPDGNKDIAYLRIERGIRPKGSEEEWPMSYVMGEMHIFSSMAQRVDPKAIWKEQLFVNMLAKLIALGLEYSELIRRAKEKRLKDEKEASPDVPDLVITDKLPAPLTENDEQYKKWLTTERQKEGL